MKYVTLPEDTGEKPLVFYLAMEEYLAGLHLPEDAFFLWQVAPTVIIGRNQVMAAEVNLPYCREKGIRVFRRKSGGGCVYADKGNIMTSAITSGSDTVFTFDRHIRLLAQFLVSLGVPAVASGRNDITADGAKVSGNAFFKKPENNIIHGTMLYNVDLERMERAITPSCAKIRSKGVSSVRQHVTNLSDYLSMDIEAFKDGLRGYFCDGSIMLSSEDVGRIEKITESYLDEKFIYGRHHSYGISKSGRVPGVGELTVEIDVEDGKIARVSLSGDYFPLCEDPAAVFMGRLAGLPVEREAVRAALKDGFPASVVRNLSPEAFVGLVFGESSPESCFGNYEPEK